MSREKKTPIGMTVKTTFITMKAELVVNDKILQKAIANKQMVEQLEKDMAIKAEFYCDEVRGVVCSVEKNFPIGDPIQGGLSVTDSKDILEKITEIFIENISELPLPANPEEDLEGCVLMVMLLDEAESLEIKNILKQLKEYEN